MTKPPLMLDRILDAMEAGVEYFRGDLSAKTGIKIQQVSTTLTALKDKRLVIKIPRVGRLCAWVKSDRAPQSEPRAQKPKPVTTMAAPPMAPDLRSTMSGYWADIERRVSLCMMARTR